jgi:Zn-finger protein
MSNPYTKTIKLDLALPLDREIAEIIELLEAIKNGSPVWDCTNKITAHVKKIETIRVTQIVEREFDEHFIDSDENP